MPKLILHMFHDDASSLSTVPALVERIQQSKAGNGTDLEVYVFGPAEAVLADSKRIEFNAQIDNLLKLGVRVTACIGLAQKLGAEAAFRTRKIALESAALAFPRFAAEGATVITF
jgi:hypothetical protein